MKCPRREENPFADHQFPGEDKWNKDNGYQRCSYCGSMHPDQFMAAIKNGAEIGPTDKNYKAYIDIPNPKSGKKVQIGSESGPAFNHDGTEAWPCLSLIERITGRVNRKMMGIAHAFETTKFYFMHFSDDQKREFIDLLNAKKLKIGMPGHFYSGLFFMRREQK